jgi:hypothetical protein
LPCLQFLNCDLSLFSVFCLLSLCLSVSLSLSLSLSLCLSLCLSLSLSDARFMALLGSSPCSLVLLQDYAPEISLFPVTLLATSISRVVVHTLWRPGVPWRTFSQLSQLSGCPILALVAECVEVSLVFLPYARPWGDCLHILNCLALLLGLSTLPLTLNEWMVVNIDLFMAETPWNSNLSYLLTVRH